jgi:hypothetical protein
MSTTTDTKRFLNGSDNFPLKIIEKIIHLLDCQNLTINVTKKPKPYYQFEKEKSILL